MFYKRAINNQMMNKYLKRCSTPINHKASEILKPQLNSHLRLRKRFILPHMEEDVKQTSYWGKCKLGEINWDIHVGKHFGITC